MARSGGAGRGFAGSAPGKGGARAPANAGGFCERGEILAQPGGKRDLGAVRVRAQLLDGGGAREHDVGPRFRRHVCDREPVARTPASTARRSRRERSAVSAGRVFAGVSRPFACASFTMTPRPSACAVARPSRNDGSRTLNVACTTSKTRSPSTRQASAASRVRRALAPVSVKPSARTSPRRRAPTRARSSGASSSTPDSAVALWIWYSASRSPSRARLSASCASKRRCDSSFSSCTAASTRQSAV